jgi:hypothetical protein
MVQGVWWTSQWWKVQMWVALVRLVGPPWATSWRWWIWQRVRVAWQPGQVQPLSVRRLARRCARFQVGFRDLVDQLVIRGRDDDLGAVSAVIGQVRVAERETGELDEGVGAALGSGAVVDGLGGDQKAANYRGAVSDSAGFRSPVAFVAGFMIIAV